MKDYSENKEGRLITKNNYKTLFIADMIEAGALKFGDFITKSGRPSPYFINTGEFNTGSRIGRLGQFYAACIADNMERGKIPKDISLLFGPAYKGIPLALAAAAALADRHGIDPGYCFNRKEAKDHGEGGSLVGRRPQDGDKVLILDDVITAGTAIRETLPLIAAAAQVKVAGMIISVDRMEKGQGVGTAVEEVRQDLGVEVFPIITVKDILTEVEDVHKTRIQEYMAKYCAR